MIHSLFHTFRCQLPKQFKGIASTTIVQRAYQTSLIYNSKETIDYSRVPVLDEHDLEERMVRGSGPGGQAVNKTNNCVALKHKPTGIIVKCHLHRMASSNRIEARRLLIARLDEHFNGELSVENQMKQLEIKKSSKSERKRKKIDEMKKKWKERENIE